MSSDPNLKRELIVPKILFIDPTKCTGCRTCEIVCSLAKEGVINPTKARVQVIKIEPVSLSVPMVCQHCYDAPCIAVCPVAALSQDEVLGLVNHDQDLCIGCKSCVAVCPFGAIGIDTKTLKVFKCDLCGGDPTCVQFCETEAIRYLDATTVNLRRKREAVSKLADLLQRHTMQPAV